MRSKSSLPMLLMLLQLWVCSGMPAAALTIEQPLSDATQELRAQALFGALKCPVCDAQSLADSDATLARQMRKQIRHMVASNNSDEAILQYFSDRYGIEILLSPPLTFSTLLLWATPVLLIFFATVLVFMSHKKIATTRAHNIFDETKE